MVQVICAASAAAWCVYICNRPQTGRKHYHIKQMQLVRLLLWGLVNTAPAECTCMTAVWPTQQLLATVIALLDAAG